MERERNTLTSDESESRELMAQYPREAVAVAFSQESNFSPHPWIANAALNTFSKHEALLPPPLDAVLAEDSPRHRSSSINVAEFVIRHFIPECVANRRSAARSYFRTILNHVLPPELVARVFATPEGANYKLHRIPGWPYLDALELRDINAEAIQRLAATALKHGYSTQMARHIRNVMSAMLSHAIRTGFYAGPNPLSRCQQ